MGKSAEAERDDGFDASLGLLLGDTWWQLGRNFAKILGSTGDARQRNLDAWAVKVRDELAENGMNEPLGGITPIAILAFVDTVMDVLEQKFEGKNIAKTVRRLTKRANDFNVYDDGQYLDIQEPAEVFWAVEYDFLFSKLDRAVGAGGWLNAVSRCDDQDCKRFFIKSRSDQRHHSEACRTRSANRRAYAERVGQPSHTKRGRPRLRR